MSDLVDADAVFAAEWTLAGDGLYERASARAVLVDAAHRVLLVRARATDGQPVRWFTVGGGIDPGEDARTAAARETFEETGVRVAPADLVGPIFRRTPTFTFLGRQCRQPEVTFLVTVGDSSVSTSAWTDVERAMLDGLDWWTLEELRTTDQVVYPPGLADLVEPVLTGRWDGTTADIGVATEVD